jgi:4'-phosphopantetheinyl transferase
LSEYRTLLDREERGRAERLLRPQDRIQFVVGRGLLKRLLGWYLHRDPVTLSFAYRPGGRPFLPEALSAGRLNFNLAHSGGLGLLAFSRDREVGIDIERIRETSPVEKLAERFFSPKEFSRLQALPAEERRQGFFQLWTYKEAYLKALGVGLYRSLAEFTLEDSGHGVSELRDPGNFRGGRRWTLRAVDAAPNFAAALVYEAPEAVLRLFEWR